MPTRVPQWLAGLVLVVATVIAFSPARHGDFIWDDDTYVTQNELLTAPDGLSRIWFSLDSPSQYFPLTFTTFRLERSLWGLNPAGYHVVNILLHAANAFLLWRVLRRLKIPGAWLAAAIFALHPVQVESVAWITERKNVLMGVFYLTALWGWVRFVEEGAVRPWRFYVLALTGQGLALAAKTTACTLWAALLLVLWLEKKPVGWRRLAQIAPFLLMGLGMGLLTVWWERFHQGTHGGTFQMGPVERLLVASRALWFYAGKLLWPVNLTFSYPRWNISASDPRAYLWLVATVAAGGVIWRGRRWTGRGVEVAAVFFAVTLSPVLGFIMLYTFVYSFVADHYQYLACIGPITLAAAAIVFHLRPLALWISLLLLLTLGGLTWRQAHIYRDSPALWRATVARNPQSWLGFADLGVNLFARGRVDEVIDCYRRARRIDPQVAEVHHNLAVALNQKGLTNEAALEFQTALALRPDFAEAHRYYGELLLREGRSDEALLQFRQAVALRPDIDGGRDDLVNTLEQKGQWDEAIAQYGDGLKFDPDDAPRHYNFGVMLLRRGRVEEAMAAFEKALAIRPNYAEAENNLGFALLRAGRAPDSAVHLQKALSIRPDFPEARYNLGNALLAEGRADEAIEQFQKTLVLQPDSVEARTRLGAIAWRLATAPDAAVRNGIKAVAVAKQIDDLAHQKDPLLAAILAASYAEAGRFDEAITTARRALTLAERGNKEGTIAAIQSQLKCYKAGAPFHAPATP